MGHGVHGAAAQLTACIWLYCAGVHAVT